MTRQIDTLLFTKTTGELDILAAVGKIFMDQLEPWRHAMQQHSDRFNVPELTNLVHRMKGSCHVLAAMAVAEEFERVEKDLRQINAENWRPVYHHLLALTKEIENELQAVISSQTQNQ